MVRYCRYFNMKDWHAFVSRYGNMYLSFRHAWKGFHQFFSEGEWIKNFPCIVWETLSDSEGCVSMEKLTMYNRLI